MRGTVSYWLGFIMTVRIETIPCHDFFVFALPRRPQEPLTRKNKMCNRFFLWL